MNKGIYEKINNLRAVLFGPSEQQHTEIKEVEELEKLISNITRVLSKSGSIAIQKTEEMLKKTEEVVVRCGRLKSFE